MAKKNSGAIAIGVVLSVVVLIALSEGTKKDDTHERFLREQKALNAIAQHKVEIGMTEDECREAWGSPDRINPTTLNNNSVHEQWCYEPYGGSAGKYLYFDDGILTSYQGSPWSRRSVNFTPSPPEQTREEVLRRQAEVLKKAGLTPSP